MSDVRDKLKPYLGTRVEVRGTFAKWDDNWKMVAGEQTWIDDSRYRVFRNWVLNHTIHHRAQLGVDLRLLNVKVPGVYGPSADEM